MVRLTLEILKRKPTVSVSLFAFSIGSIGAVGQAIMLRHELSDCLPYKVVAYSTYTSIANAGVWIAPLIAISLAVFVIRRNLWLPLSLPVVLSPIVFACIFRVLSATRGLDLISQTNISGDFTVSKAAEQFYSFCGFLTLWGTVIGLLIAFGLGFLTNTRKLP